MAQQEIICCSVCLDLLKEPVTIPCGHSYCMRCIGNFWDGEVAKGIYSCPQCRQTFTPRPVLVKNTMLADLVEELRNRELQAAPDDGCYAGPADVGCDSCTGRKLKAIKSCLVCLVSYCEKHLQPHYNSPGFKNHKLAEPSKKLQDNICSNHDEVMKMFCRTDRQCICYLCSVDEHKGHDIVTAAAARTEMQRELGESQQKVQQKIQDRKKDVTVLQQEVEAIDRSADEAVRDSEKLFTQLICLIVERSSEVMQQIRSQQKAEVSRAEELQEKLEEEIAELSRRDAELQQLSTMEDNAQFLSNYLSLPHLSESSHSDIKIYPVRYFEEVMAALSAVTNKLQEILSEEWGNISLVDVDVLLSPAVPMTRAGCLRYSHEITMDPNTPHARLSLSEGNREVSFTDNKNSYSSHPDRFTSVCQVLSTESVTGRCYWEVEWSGTGVGVAVAYKDIDRTSQEGKFGFNEKSWSLYDYGQSCQFRQNCISTSLSSYQSCKIGVYLDHSAGLLSFYSVSETMTLLHRVQTTFTQPLYAGFWLYRFGDTVEFV
ncbi:tripartite motif-containing protein 16-like [Genypterus blacodes]|uniref:tripartite motif-containing protein 16-like n=1 Tax=Genypterus blacodes TaxID=154954 RepID=UPI003F75C288